jgi:hypothetical protein
MKKGRPKKNGKAFARASLACRVNQPVVLSCGKSLGRTVNR